MAEDRRDDWKRGVDENLAAINEGRRVTEREIQRLWKAYSDDDALLRGDKEKETDGMISRLHSVENEINLIKAVLLKDAAGGRGLVGRVETLEGAEKRSDRHWQAATAITIAVLSLIGLLVTNWPKITAFFDPTRKDPIGQAIERAKHPPRKRIHITIDARDRQTDDPPEEPTDK